MKIRVVTTNTIRILSVAEYVCVSGLSSEESGGQQIIGSSLSNEHKGGLLPFLIPFIRNLHLV